MKYNYEIYIYIYIHIYIYIYIYICSFLSAESDIQQNFTNN